MGNNNDKKKQINKSKNSKSSHNNKKSKDLKNIKNDVLVDDESLAKTELLDITVIKEEVKKSNVASDIEVLDFDEKINDLKIKNKYDDKSKKNEFVNVKVGILPTCLFILSSFVLGVSVSLLFSDKFLNGADVHTEEVEIKIVNDDNYVFLGDSIMQMYDLKKHYDGLPVVNSGISGNTTYDVLNNLKDRVYRYNPSKVFILIGTNDVLLDEHSNEETVSNIGKIIDEIKKNRPYAEIFVQSIYPVNSSDDDKINSKSVYIRNNIDIQIMNKSIESICKEKGVTYIDMYSLLVDDSGNLDINYTTEGLHITDAGYSVITKKLMEYINEK